MKQIIFLIICAFFMLTSLYAQPVPQLQGFVKTLGRPNKPGVPNAILTIDGHQMDFYSLEIPLESQKNKLWFYLINSNG